MTRVLEKLQAVYPSTGRGDPLIRDGAYIYVGSHTRTLNDFFFFVVLCLKDFKYTPRFSKPYTDVHIKPDSAKIMCY